MNTLRESVAEKDSSSFMNEEEDLMILLRSPPKQLDKNPHLMVGQQAIQ